MFDNSEHQRQIRILKFSLIRLELQLRKVISKTLFCLTLLVGIPAFIIIYLILDILQEILTK